jgi:hypothetical protein
MTATAMTRAGARCGLRAFDSDSTPAAGAWQSVLAEH